MEEFVVKYWLEVVFSVIAAGIGIACKCLAKKRKKQNDDQKSLRNGTQALLRNEIIRSYEKYMEKKWIPLYARENVTVMYNAYHDLGGNGPITQLMEELSELPTMKPEGGDTGAD
jgi:hypothetical protein